MMHGRGMFSAVHGRYVQEYDGRVGIFGKPTALIDWCEENFERTPVIAEFFNTLSSLAMIFYALFGYISHKRYLETRFSLIFLGIFLTGVGSCLFHGTLLLPFQMMDELPMVYTSLIATYAIVEGGRKKRFGPWFPLFLFGYSIIVTVLMVTNVIAEYSLFLFVFQSSLVFNILSIIWMVFISPWVSRYNPRRVSNTAATCRILRSTARKQQRNAQVVYDADAGSLLGSALLSTLVGTICWYLDINMCAAIHAYFGKFNPQLHAWWHVLATFGLYLLALVIIQRRFKVLGLNPKIVFTHPLILVPVIVPGSEASKFTQNQENFKISRKEL